MILSVYIIAVMCANPCKIENFLSVLSVQSVRDKAFFLTPTHPILGWESFETAEFAERKVLVIFGLLAEKAATRSSCIALRRLASWLCTVRC